MVDRTKINDLERLISPSRFRDQPVDLVVLSACETASGDDRAAISRRGFESWRSKRTRHTLED